MEKPADASKDRGSTVSAWLGCRPGDKPRCQRAGDHKRPRFREPRL